MDWRLIGAFAGIVALAGATAAGVSFVYHSSPNDLISRKVPPSPTLILTAPPRIAMDPPRPSAEPSLPPSPPPLLEARTEPAGGDNINGSNNQYPPEDLAKPPPSSDHKARLPAPRKQMARLPPPSEHPKPAPPSVSIPPPPQPKKSVQEWRAVPTERAGPFNLGGHIDQNGVVDSVASERLREALKTSKNYRRIPAEAKAWIEAPNINLSKLAPYRAMLGIDDRTIDAEQGVKFVRVANTRGIDDETDLEADMAEFPPGIAKGDIEPLVLPLIR